MLRQIRFDGPQEAAFRIRFEELGRDSRGQLWGVLLAAMIFVLVFHSVFLKLPPQILPLTHLAILGVMAPAAMRWLSSDWSPLHRWSAELYIGAALIDIACLMWLRVACLREGYDVVPLMLPIAILMSLIVVQIRFLLLAPVVLLTFSVIVGVELWAFDNHSNMLFQIAAAGALVVVGLSPAYELERWTRVSWLQEQQLNELACTDGLTGLSNRRHFDTSLRQAIRMAARERKNVALMILDIDHFKSYNDHYGHPAGDACLEAVGSYLGGAMRRPNDFAARLGGEEFAAVWFDATPEDAVRLAQDLRRGLSRLGLAPAPGHGSAITASAGFIQISTPQPAEATEDIAIGMMHLADAALYEAKHAGRDRLVASDKQLPPTNAQRPSNPRSNPAYAEVSRRKTDAPAHGRSAKRLDFDDPLLESEFRTRYEEQGRGSRTLILLGLLGVITLILMFQRSALKIPEEAELIGQLTLLVGLVPATLIALAGSTWKPLHRHSAMLYIGAILVILFAQMLQRVIQLPKGYDVVPLLMPVSVLLSLTVVQIRFRLLVPAALLALAGVIGAELFAFQLTTHRFLEVGTAALMVLVTLNFSYALERWTRISWQRKRLLHERACSDALTGLANRRHFDNSLRQVIRMAARERKNVALMMLDIDHFKSYNDHYGHPAGDICLETVGRYLGGIIRRPHDFAARLGGEEFAVVWFDAAPEDAARLAEELRRGISALGVVPAPAHGAALTASAGFVQIIAPQPEEAAEHLAVQMMHQADAALYEAKRTGRNRLIAS